MREKEGGRGGEEGGGRIEEEEGESWGEGC